LKKEDFLRHFSGLSNIELLKILEEREKYQPAAIEMAQQILSERNYSNDEMSTAKAEVNFIVNKKIERQEKINKRINNINEVIDENFGIKEKTPKKLLNLFCFALFLFNLIDGFFSINDFTYLFASRTIGYIFGVLVYLLPLLIIYLLYKRNNWGWILLVAVYAISAILNIQTLYESFTPQNDLFGLFYVRVNPYFVALALFFDACVIWFLNKKNILQQFSIAKDTRILTFAVSAIISILFVFIFK
jgi:hypothetical protein